MRPYNLPSTPLTRLLPWYPGQLGIAESDAPLGIRLHPDAVVLYVDGAHGNANDANVGTDPQNPKATVQGAIDSTLLVPYSVILVSGNVAESASILVTDEHHCAIIGNGLNAHSPEWTSGAVGTPCLSIEAEGWVIAGLTFNCPSASSGIQLRDTGGAQNAYKTTIYDCVFDGLWGGLYGIDFIGAPHRVQILDCTFTEMHQGANDAYCIMVSDTALGAGSPYQCKVSGCRFMDSDNYVGGLGAIRGFNVSLFIDNVFEQGVLLIPALYLDLRGGSRGFNIVTRNFFGAAYTNAGGYFANPATANSCWVGNTAEPTPATVADNGITIATP